MADAPAAKDTESLLPEGKPAPASLSTGFAMVFLVGFNVALIVAAAYMWKAECDAPLKGFLIAYAVVGLIVSLIFAKVAFMTNKDLPGGKIVPIVMFVVFLLAGLAGVMNYAKADKCIATATLLYKWSFAAILAFAIFVWLVVSVPLVQLLTPLLGKFVKMLVGALMGCMGALQGMADSCESFSEKKKEGTEKDSGSIFAYYVNCSALVWFFAYFVIEVYRHQDAACDQPLHLFILVFGFVGTALTLMVFYNELLGSGTPEGGSSSKKIFLGLFLVCMLWFAIGAYWYNSVQTCEDTAPTIYRLAGLLVLAFYVVLLMIAILLGLLGLDFLCSGRLRVVVILDNQ